MKYSPIDRAKGLSRRELMGISLATLPALAYPGIVRAAGGDACLVTARQSEGPFYPVQSIPVRADLIGQASGGAAAQGRQIIVQGQVTAGDCRPLPGAMVEIWQADSQGRYNHPQDPRAKDLDPHFRYWGRVMTDAQGRYEFRTIAPAPYPAGGGWMRPPHIHFKVRRGGARTLTTQMYFPGNPLNGKDFLFTSIAPALRETVIAIDLGVPGGAALPLPRFQFDVTLI